MQKIWETSQFKEVYDANTTSFELGTTGLRVQTFCHSLVYRGWRHSADLHRPNIIVFMILSGEQRLIRQDGSSEMVRDGYFSIINLNTIDVDFLTLSPCAERYFILLEINPLLQNILQEMFHGGLPAFHAANPPRLQKCFENIRKEITSSEADDSKIGGAAYTLLHEAMKQLPGNPLPQPLLIALNYIDNHFQEVHLSREEIAAAARVSVSTLAALFRKHLQTTIWHTIEQKRMDNVRQLLTFSNKSISEIASACGFSYAYYLTREFRRRYNMTPSVYRQVSRRSSGTH